VPVPIMTACKLKTGNGYCSSIVEQGPAHQNTV
jgi:hypothetical protein